MRHRFLLKKCVLYHCITITRLYISSNQWPPRKLLSYYLANKRSLHVRSQGLEIPTLIGEK